MYPEFRLGPWNVQASLNTVSGNGSGLRLEPKAMEVLVYLAKCPGDVVSKEQLIQGVWGDTFVTDDVLTLCISELRKAFEGDAKEPRVIQTIPKRGYRLLVKVEPIEPTPPPKPNIFIRLAIPLGLCIGALVTILWMASHPAVPVIANTKQITFTAAGRKAEHD